MVNRILVFMFLPCFFLALFLFLAGVRQVEFGDSYYNFLATVTHSFEAWKIEIPQIPKIPKLDNSGFDDYSGIVELFRSFANAFFTFINAIIYVINIVITIVNIAIQLIQFILTFVYQTKDFITRTASS